MNSTITAVNDAEIAAAASSEANFTETDISGEPTWQSIVLNVAITNADAAYKTGDKLQIFYALSTTASIDDAGPLRGMAGSFTVQIPPTAEGVFYFVSPVFPATGDTLYTWFAHDDWNTTRDITITANGVAYGPVVTPAVPP